jgi:murein DD-endopeptidase MepM/ murein hydrolase activator NlpD
VKKGILLIFLLLAAGLIMVVMPRRTARSISIQQNIKFNPHRQIYTFFELNGISFKIPVMGWSLDTLLYRSVLYVPHDIVRDGLPWFGALRDDWRLGREGRFHQGIDIYGDSLQVAAVQSGVVEKAYRDNFSGGVVKIDHGDFIKTVYIHLSQILVTEGMQVAAGMVIGAIVRPEGNAVQSQLHFELQINGEKRDPIDYVEKSYRYAPSISKALAAYKEKKNSMTRQRAGKVRAIN